MADNVSGLRRRFALRRRLDLSGDADLGSDKPGLTGLGQNDVVRTLHEPASPTRLHDISARTLASDLLLHEVFGLLHKPSHGIAIFFEVFFYKCFQLIL